MFPNTFHASAAPRWSHRDPVEGGNPFPRGAPKHQHWNAATDEARRTLERFDARLSLTAQVTLDPFVYLDQLLDLAVGRFDVWARRGLAAVSWTSELEDYRRWLGDYTQNWLEYVADTCPRVELGDDLRTRLDARAAYWLTAATTSVDFGDAHLPRDRSQTPSAPFVETLSTADALGDPCPVSGCEGRLDLVFG